MCIIALQWLVASHQVEFFLDESVGEIFEFSVREFWSSESLFFEFQIGVGVKADESEKAEQKFLIFIFYRS